MSSKPKRGQESTNSALGGRFSQLDEMDDLRPLGHGAEAYPGTRSPSITGNGDAGIPEEMAVPSRRIGVKTDIVVERTDRLSYNDRLY